MTVTSLQDVMNHVSRTLEQTPADNSGLSHNDPLLAGLYKDYLDARGVHARLVKTVGPDDAMTVVAADRMDSCLSAFETRLIELRGAMSRNSVERLKDLKAEMDARDAESRQSSEAYHQKLEQFYGKRRQELIEESKKHGESGFFYLLLLYYMFQHTATVTQRRLRMASEFMAAAIQDNVQPEKIRA